MSSSKKEIVKKDSQKDVFDDKELYLKQLATELKKREKVLHAIEDDISSLNEQLAKTPSVENHKSCKAIIINRIQSYRSSLLLKLKSKMKDREVALQDVKSALQRKRLIEEERKIESGRIQSE